MLSQIPQERVCTCRSQYRSYKNARNSISLNSCTSTQGKGLEPYFNGHIKAAALVMCVGNWALAHCRAHQETYPLDTDALQGCHSARGWLVAVAAQAQLPVAIVAPDVDLGKTRNLRLSSSALP